MLVYQSRLRKYLFVRRILYFVHLDSERLSKERRRYQKWLYRGPIQIKYALILKYSINSIIQTKQGLRWSG